jgi:hypothetical protein
MGARIATAPRAFVLAALMCGCPERRPAAAHADAAASEDARADAVADAAARAADAGGDDALPPSRSDEMTSRMKHLLEAVAHDNPDLGVDVLLPRDAYLAVKDSADPGKAWDAKVKNVFVRGVHAAHKRTKGAERAQFVAFEIGHSVTQLAPKRRRFKRPLWHVKRSRLTFSVDGKTQHLDILEMAGWRGNWYVTKIR